MQTEVSGSQRTARVAALKGFGVGALVVGLIALMAVAAFREAIDPYPLRRPAPTLGQDNEAILGERLGLSRNELDRLAEIGVIGTVPDPRRPQGDA